MAYALIFNLFEEAILMFCRIGVVTPACCSGVAYVHSLFTSSANSLSNCSDARTEAAQVIRAYTLLFVVWRPWLSFPHYLPRPAAAALVCLALMRTLIIYCNLKFHCLWGNVRN